MNSVILLAGLLVGAPTAPAASSSPPAPRRISVGDARLMSRFAADPSGFSPLFGKGDPGAHPVRFGIPAGGMGGAPPKARDDGLTAALFRPRATTSLQMSWPLK